jgi:hypothetical protein
MQVPICRHIKTNGLQCRGVAVSGSAFCYFHSKLHNTHELYRNKVHFQSAQIAHPRFLELPAVEDRESAQLAISCVLNALATQCIDAKQANALFYGLSLAAANARGLRIVRRPTQMVRDIYKEPWITIPEASPDIAPPGQTCEIEDPATPDSIESPDPTQPTESGAPHSRSDCGVTTSLHPPTELTPQPITSHSQSALAPLPFFVGDAGDGEEGVAGVDVAAETVHATDGVEFFGADVGARAVLLRDDEAVFDIHGDDAAEDDAGAANLSGGELAALERGVGFGDARDFDDRGGRGGEAGHFQLVDAGGEVGGGDVHLLDEVFGDYVDDELAGAADVVGGVLRGAFAAGAIGNADAYDGRVGAEVVVSAEGRGVEGAVFVHAGDPGDGARCYQADKQAVNLTRRRLIHFKVHSRVLTASLPQESIKLNQRLSGGREDSTRVRANH